MKDGVSLNMFGRLPTVPLAYSQGGGKRFTMGSTVQSLRVAT